MIAFASLFLGLVVGVAPVGVLVEKSVAAVQLELDGRAVGRIARAPWSLTVDFGAELAPHELVARGFDREGREIGLARQLVNLPRPPAEVEILLERDEEGRPVAARFSGQSLLTQGPPRAAVAFDGKPLSAQEGGRVRLPSYDPETRHVLSVELEFLPSVRSRADVVLGAGASSVVQSDLTAVPVRVSAEEIAPDVAQLFGSFLRAGAAVRVVAFERGPALVCVVRGPGAAAALKAIGTGGKTTLVNVPGGRRLPQFDRDASRHLQALEENDRMRFIWPVPRTSGTARGAELFDRSRDFEGSDGGVPYLLTRVEHPEARSKGLRLADAAAVAGLEAAGSGGRRAVILVLGDETEDASRHDPAAVRRYLEAIRVPLAVWSLKSPSSQKLAARWGAVEDVSSAPKLEEAIARLKDGLASQRIAWIEGRCLPREVSLSGKFPNLELLR